MDRLNNLSDVGGLSASIAFVIGLCSTAMLALLCCSFFWLKKRCRRRPTSSDRIVPRIRITPVIRSNDIISFVLPSTSQNSGECSGTDQLEMRLSGSESPLNSSRIIRHCSSAVNISDLNNIRIHPAGQESTSKIGISLQYELRRQELLVKVLGCVDLNLRNKKAPDPCVKVSLVPNKSALKFATRTLRSTTNPLFNESFIFPLTSGDLCSVHLKLKVCDRYDLSRYVGQSTSPGGGLRAAVSSSLASRLIPLGFALVNLSELDLMSIDETGATRRRVVWFQLKEPSQVPDVVKTHEVATSKGQMLLSLVYDAQNGRMTLHIVQVRNLQPQANLEQEKILVKILLFERGYLTASSRSKAIRRSSDSAIQLDETFVVSLDTKRLHETSCQILLVSTRSKMSRKRTLGRVTLGHRHFFSTDNKSLSPTGLDHWHDMEHRPGVAIERWHDLI